MIIEDIKLTSEWEYEWHPPKVSKEDFIPLAEALVEFKSYFDELDNSRRELAKKHNIETDFIGNDYFGGRLESAVLDLLGSDFEYWFYDCEKDFETFNKAVTLKDGKKPNVRNLSDLYDLSKEIE